MMLSVKMPNLSLMLTAAIAALALTVPCHAQPAKPNPLPLRPGPHLLLDDYLIARSDGVQRVVMQPKRLLDQPVVTSGKGHENWQPWLTVLHDPAAPKKQRFRMWYNASDNPDHEFSHVAYLESADGIAWPGPYRALDVTDSVIYGDSVLDSGPGTVPPEERFKILFYGWGPPVGPRVAFSADGLKWTRRGADEPAVKVEQGNDSWHAGFDPIRKRYFLICKHNDTHTWTNAEGQKLTRRIRLYAISFSQDFKRWTPPKLIFRPDAKDPGITQWYGVVGFQTRGDLIVAFLQVLRDDLSAAGVPKEAIAANMGNPGAGVGYTVLAWTRDGETWHRDRHTDPFFEPDPRPGTWDHAMAWVSSAVPVDDELYLYYAGYRWGHKYRRGDDRQVGLVKIKQDRYVARRAGKAGGQITTPLVTIDAQNLTLNADATDGEVRVGLLDADGKPIDGFAVEDCQPIRGDSLSAPVQWKRPLRELAGRPVRLMFQLRNASLFAFGL